MSAMINAEIKYGTGQTVLFLFNFFLQCTVRNAQCAIWSLCHRLLMRDILFQKHYARTNRQFLKLFKTV